MRREAAFLFKSFAIVFAVLSLACFAIGVGAQWSRDAAFDVLGVLPLLRNIGHLFAYFWGAAFAAAAVGCLIKALRLAG